MNVRRIDGRGGIRRIEEGQWDKERWIKIAPGDLEKEQKTATKRQEAFNEKALADDAKAERKKAADETAKKVAAAEAEAKKAATTTKGGSE